jgi:serine/threonine protein kinase
MAPGGPDSDRTVVAGARSGGTLHPGDQILNNTYVIKKLLGKGGMGEVYEAEHIELGARRAIKIILPEYAKNTQYVGLFIEEARKLSRVNNDAIVRYYEFSRDAIGARYLVMEFVAGESLAETLEHRRFESAEVFGLLERLAQGLAAAYDQGIKAHRDISPANILLPQGRADQAKVIDFGIAKSGDGGVTLIGSDFAGKYSYVSPEQVGLFGGQEDVNEKSDIYCLGLLLAAAAMGFGKRLDMGNEPASVIRARQSVPDLSAIPAELRPLLTRMLQPRSQARPASMRALIEEARQLTQRRGARASATAAVPVRSHSQRRIQAWQRTTGIVGLLLAISIGTFALWPRATVEPTPPAAEKPAASPATLTPPVAAPPTTVTPQPQAVVQPLPPQAAVLPPPPPLAPPDPRAELNEAIKNLDCASLHTGSAADGAESITGTVRDPQDQAMLTAIAARLPPDARAQIDVSIVPPPVCRFAGEFDRLQAGGLVSRDGIEVHLVRGGETLHEGEPIAVEVKSLRDYPVNLRIDYFTLDGEVLHMWPNADLPTAKLPAGETREFLHSGPGNAVWRTGGAPFGTEFIAVTATTSPLDFGTTLAPVGQADDYLRVLRDALDKTAQTGGQPNLAATIFVHTSEK